MIDWHYVRLWFRIRGARIARQSAPIAIALLFAVADSLKAQPSADLATWGMITAGIAVAALAMVR